MAKGKDRDSILSSKAKQGLWKLMLKLPASRDEIQILATKHETLGDLCEAYEEASEMLHMIRSAESLDRKLLHEYDRICNEIEGDVINYCIRLKYPKGIN